MSLRVADLIRYLPVCLLIAGSLSTAVGQTTYYVSSAGKDSNSGKSTDSPFQTIAKINTLTLSAGDQILFRRSDTFSGNLQIRQSGTSDKPIIVDAYGSGNKPILAGATPVTNWSNIGNNTWQASCSSCGSRVTGIYQNNSALPLGRYPNLSDSNKGYLTVQSHSGQSQLTSQQGLSTNWTGGEAVFRPVQWILNRATINGQNGNTLYLANSGSYDIADGWGYFIQNHPSTLDQAGEWYYNPSDKTIRLFDNQNNPNNQSITVTNQSEAVNLTNVSYITIRNLKITQAVTTNLLIQSSSNIVISANDIAQAGEDGLLLNGNGENVLMENNLIEDINNNGVGINSYQGITFRRNTLQRIGLTPGRGRSGDGTYFGFLSSSYNNTLIEDNVLDNIGYNALNFSTKSTIQRNRISNFCLTKSDGSGLYIWNGNQQALSDIRILSNVVYNGIGATEGTPGGTYTGANGIYLDDCTINAEMSNNTVYNCKGYGIYLHGTTNISVQGNTSFNNGEGQFVITSANNCQPRNNSVQNNLFVSKLASQFNVKYESVQNDLGSFGQFDNNVYSRPFEDTYTIRGVYNGNIGADWSLAEWRSRYGKDQTSTKSPITYSSGNPDDVIAFVANPTGSAIQTSLNGSYRDLRNVQYSGQVSVAPYSSIVLLKEVSTTNPPTTTLRAADNPANAVSGLDYSYYEGSWGSLPDFNSLTPVKTGTNGTVDFGVRNRGENYGLRYTGYVNVPADGTYTFYTNSDDGSKLYIGSTEIVNNDGGHAEQEKSGSIGLKAGKHAITITYFQGGGGQALSVSFEGPSTGKQTIPASAFFRVPGSTTPTPTPNLRAADNPANAVSGLDYSYYEGNWGNLPDFNSLTPVKTGTNGTVDIGVRNRGENYGLRYTGYVNVPADGTYTFYTNSDDGSKLYIGSTEIVNNDGSHAEQEKSGSIGLKAGKHALTITYYQGGGGQAMSVSFEGPSTGKQTIPASAFFRVPGSTTPTPTPTPTPNLRAADNPANAVAGLDYSYYEGNWGSLPDFNSLTPVKTGTNGTVDIGVRNRGENYGLRYTGYVNVPADGTYTFYTNSDDGSKLYIGSTEIVNNDGSHAEQEKSGSIGLKAGKHALTITYYQGGGGQAMSVSFEGPSTGKQTIPASAFFRVPAATVAGDGTGLRGDYFNNRSLTSPMTLTRTDAVIDFGWGNGSPASSINNDNFSVRWTGRVKAPATGNYTFTTSADDGVRLWINGQQVIDDWAEHDVTNKTSPVLTFTAGQYYDVRLEYFEASAGAVVRLQWTYPNQGLQIVPQMYLYPTSVSSRRASLAAVEPDEETTTQVYPVPARDEVRVRYFAKVAGDVKLNLTSVGALTVMQKTSPVVAGENIIRVPVAEYSRGMYILTIAQDNVRVTRKVLLTD